MGQYYNHRVPIIFLENILFFLYDLNVRQYHDIKTLCIVDVIQQFCICAYNCVLRNTVQ